MSPRFGLYIKSMNKDNNKNPDIKTRERERERETGEGRGIPTREKCHKLKIHDQSTFNTTTQHPRAVTTEA